MDTLPKMQKMRVPPQKYDYLTETEADLLLNHSAGMWHDMILLDIRTGLRFGELIGLRWEDVDMKERVLVVNQSIVRDIIGSPKSNKARVIPITDSVVQLLQDRRHNGEYVFHDESGSPLKYDVCRRKLLRICEVAGLRPISWHKLRHSFATHLSNKRNPIVDIKELLGHSDIKTTMRYVHTNLNALTGTINSLENG